MREKESVYSYDSAHDKVVEGPLDCCFDVIVNHRKHPITECSLPSHSQFIVQERASFPILVFPQPFIAAFKDG